MLRVAGAGDAVEAAAGAAVQAVGRLALAVEMDQEPVGARRRPGFLDAERLHRTDLHRLEAVAATCERGRDPVIGHYRRDHVLAEIVFLEYELDQMRAPCEQAEKEPALRVAMDSRRIARQIARNHLAPGDAVAGEREAAETMRPALGEKKTRPVPGDSDSIGIRQFAQQHARIVERRAADDQPSVAALLHDVVPPLVRTAARAALDGEDAAVRRGSDRQQPGKAATVVGFEPAWYRLRRI